MREILFRGKRLDNGEWVSSGNIIRFEPEEGKALVFIPAMHERCVCAHDDNDNITAFETGMFYKVDPDTVGQYTGLTDKNGKRIFEGDIMVFCKGATYPYKITWDGIGWKLIRSDGKRIKEAFECNEIRYANISEVIGNIHDNPELLKGDNTNG